MKLFWFSKIGTKDSFSRITESILPILKNEKNVKLYTIIPPNLQLEPKYRSLFTNILTMGDNIHEGNLKLEEQQFMGPMKPNLGSKMKYIILQTLAHCQEHNIRTLLITMGVYEADWFMETIESIRNTETANFLLNNVKIVIYVPFDYIPSSEAIENLLKADTIITTVPYVLDYIPLDDWVGHANEACFMKLKSDKTTLINLINSIKFWTGEKIKYNDLIILNANLYGERKRIDITIKAFENALEKHPNLKLWLHGGHNDQLKISDKVKKRLLISNKISTNELNLIYNVCKIGINTSWGEGWSLTNCEHAITGAIQVVPNWLACKFHFSENRGLLIDVEETESVNEAGKKVIIGIPIQESANKKLLEAIELQSNWDPQNTIDYINQYSWNKSADKLYNIVAK